MTEQLQTNLNRSMDERRNYFNNEIQRLSERTFKNFKYQSQTLHQSIIDAGTDINKFLNQTTLTCYQR
jgi:hypothetical protein